MKKIQFFLIFLIFSSSLQYKGVDLSEYEGDVDWSRLSPNIDFSILRANWKIGIDENQFENNYAGAKNYGVSVGAYWYSYAHNEEEAAKEAKDCLDIIKGKQFEYPIFYYIMKQETFDTGLTNQILDTFCSILEKAGYYCGVYSALPYYFDYFDKDISNKYPVWVAYWDSNEPTIPHSIWQYGVEYIEGVKGPVDVDITNTDFPQIIKEKHLNGY